MCARREREREGERTLKDTHGSLPKLFLLITTHPRSDTSIGRKNMKKRLKEQIRIIAFEVTTKEKEGHQSPGSKN